MRITIEGKQYSVPTSLVDITLAQRIAFEKQYGKGLRDQLKKLIEMKDGPMKEMEFTAYHCELACKTLSFFGGIPLDIVENSKLDDVLAIYHSSMKSLGEDADFTVKEFELITEFSWKGDTWVIAPPELKHDSAMSFGEFLDAKQWVKNMYEYSQEKYGALLGLCCVYFRKKGEQYSKELSVEGGERYKLMESLPMDFALHVGFFLSASMDTYMKTFPSSSSQEGAPADQN